MAKRVNGRTGPYLLHLELISDRIPDANRFPYTEHYLITRGFLSNPKGTLSILLAGQESKWLTASFP